MKTFRSISLFSIILLLSANALASVEVMGSLKHAFKAKPGDVIKGEIRIQNNDSTDQEVRVYQTDLLFNLEEKTFYDEPGSHQRTNAQWIQFSPKSVILKSNESRLIQYEITVPQDEKINGTYWSVIMVEGVVPIDPNQKGDLNIRTVTRYAIQMVTDLTNEGNGLLKFNEPTLVKEDKKLFLAVDIVNNGDHYIAPEVTLELFDESGQSAGIITASKKGLYPTTSSRFKLDLEGIPSKKTYKAMIIAAGQGDDVFGLEYTLYF